MKKLSHRQLIRILVPVGVVLVVGAVGVTLYFTVFKKHHHRDPIPALAPFTLPTLPQPAPYEPQPGTRNFKKPDFHEIQSIELPFTGATDVRFNIPDEEDYMVLTTKHPDSGYTVCLYTFSGQTFEFRTYRSMDPVNSVPNQVQTMSMGSFGVFVVSTKTQVSKSLYQGYITAYVASLNGTFQKIQTLQNPNGGHASDQFGRVTRLVRTANNGVMLYVGMRATTSSDGYPEIREYQVDMQNLALTQRSVLSRGSSVSEEWGKEICALPHKELLIVSNRPPNEVGNLEIWQYNAGSWHNVSLIPYPDVNATPSINAMGNYMDVDESESFLVVGCPEDGRHHAADLEGSLLTFRSKGRSTLEWELVERYNFSGYAKDSGFGYGVSLTKRGRMVAVGTQSGIVHAFPIDQANTQHLVLEDDFSVHISSNNMKLIQKPNYNRIRLYVADLPSKIRVWETHAF